MAVIWCFPAMKRNLRQWSSCKEMVFVCVIWSFDDMGLGEQVILSDKESKGATMNECREVTEKYRTGRSAYLRIGQLFMRLFAGLL